MPDLVSGFKNFKTDGPKTTIVIQIPTEDIPMLITLIAVYNADTEIPQELRNLWLAIVKQFPKRIIEIKNTDNK